CLHNQRTGNRDARISRSSVTCGGVRGMKIILVHERQERVTGDRGQEVQMGLLPKQS
ncbi:Uncharacterized protein DAT39_001596, partial [Clarias magur]